MDELTENAIKTLNAGLLAKTNALALKNRKVYMITEKFDDSLIGGNGHNSGSVGGGNATGGSVKGGPQKRKMYLIMEEKETEDKSGAGQTEKCYKSDGSNGNKKLTLFTDTTNGQLPQKIEKILPEILSCIQAKGAANGSNGSGSMGNGSNAGSASSVRCVSQELNGKIQAISSSAPTSDNENSKIRMKPDTDNNERLPLTLPPKKNRTKIITTQIIPVNNSHPYHHHHPLTVPLVQTGSNGNTMTTSELQNKTISTNGSSFNSSSGSYVRADKSSATPVIVNATTLIGNGDLAATVGASNGTSKENGNKLNTITTPQLHKNINLSTDFLFLMKMLPKLESIAEPHKNYVKACIEDVINQYAPPTFGDQ